MSLVTRSELNGLRVRCESRCVPTDFKMTAYFQVVIVIVTVNFHVLLFIRLFIFRCKRVCVCVCLVIVNMNILQSATSRCTNEKSFELTSQ